MNVPLPAWIDPQAWGEFVDMRKRIKKPLTQNAAERALYRLYELKQAGHDPNKSLLQSADCYWMALYPPKELPLEPKKTAEAESWLDQHRKAKEAAMSPAALEARKKAMASIKGVA